jgi:HPt (histidine-containing phosphotransfer) domain-containing protein
LGEKGVTSHIPIVGVTADVVALDQESFLLAGMEWCLTRPIDPRRLLQLIEHFGQLSLRNFTGQTVPEGAIDLSWLRTLFQNDEEVVSEILGAFLDEIDSLWLTLFRKVLTKESEGIRMSAHAIKGSLQSVGARAAAESARLIEYAAKAGTLEELDSLVGDLAQQVKSAKECAQGLALSRVGKVESDSGHSNLTAIIETKG